MQFPIDLEQYDRREQLKKSGLGKVLFSYRFNNISWEALSPFLCVLVQVIMFLSKSDEETTANRKLAKELVDKWVKLQTLISFLRAC